MTEFYTAIFVLFLLQLFATRSLNEGAPDSLFWRGIWAVEVACIALVFAGLVTGRLGLVQIAMPASVALFGLRAAVRCYDLGVSEFAKKGLLGIQSFTVNLCAGIVKVAPGLGALLMVFLEALPDAFFATTESNSESTESSDGPASLTNFKHVTGFGAQAFSVRDSWWDES